MIAKTKFKNLYSAATPLILENGERLETVTVAYQTFGKLNDDRTNVILINHALTGNAHAAGIIEEDELKNTKSIPQLYNYNKMYFGKDGWWSPLIGPGKAIDTISILLFVRMFWEAVTALQDRQA